MQASREVKLICRVILRLSVYDIIETYRNQIIPKGSVWSHPTLGRSKNSMIPMSEVVVLTVIGLTVGGVFLVYLLIGDRREAKREAQEKARRTQLAEASQEYEGVWPPPPDHVSANKPADR